MVYLIVFILLSIFGIKFYNNPESKYFRFAQFLCFFIFVYIAGMRYEIGVDYFNYVYSFNKQIDFITFIKNGLPDTNTEIGFCIYSIIVKSFFNEPQMLFFIASLFCTSVLFYTLSFVTEKRYFFLSLLLYFSFVYLLLELHTLRQAMAASFTYLSWMFLLQNKNLKAFYTMALGCLFHNSVFLLFPLLLFINKKISNKVQLAMIFISFLIALLKIHWVSGISNVLSIFFPTMTAVAKFSKYADGTTFERGIFVLYFVYLFIYLFFVYKEQMHSQLQTPKFALFKNIFFVFLVITNLFWDINYISTRMGWFLLFGFVICSPYIIESFQFFSKSIIIGFIIVLCIIPTRAFFFPFDNKQMGMFSPYEDYLQCKVFEFHCDGKQRAYDYVKSTSGKILFTLL